tara:strand:+ start:639 stop:1709 length:1071 start_codon:yes stop_codon:yes gene_type:complete
MEFKHIISKIRKLSLISCLLPFITINICFLLFQFLGNYSTHLNYDLNKKYSTAEYLKVLNKDKHLFTACSKYGVETFYVNSKNQEVTRVDAKKILIANSEIPRNGSDFIESEMVELLQIQSVYFKSNEIIDERCIKNNKFMYYFLNNFRPIEKILVNTSRNYSKGFGNIVNPYIYGEVSISRTARYFPANVIFKFFIILSSVFLFLYWKNNLKLFKNLKERNILKNYSNQFFYFGILSCVFLFLHATFLGLDFDSKLFILMRRIIIVLFIVFEVCAQASLTINLYTYRKNMEEIVKPKILQLKVFFVITIFFITSIIFAFLIWGDLSSNMKHALEWNYFSILLLYYLLSRLLWRNS